jgi:nitroreductase
MIGVACAIGQIAIRPNQSRVIRSKFMDVHTAISSRASAVKLTAPGPDAQQLEAILMAGTRAPDHGRLSPWRFVVLEGEKRNILANSMAEMRRRLTPAATDEDVQREGAKAMRAPTIVAVVARTKTGGKIPEIEQIVAVGAGMQNMILTAHALGFGTMWKTGQAAYEETVKTSLGLDATDHVVGYLYLGTTAVQGTPRVANLADYLIPI